jgi:hypothetical protein
MDFLILKRKKGEDGDGVSKAASLLNNLMQS